MTAYAPVTFTGNGTTGPYVIPWPYIAQADVHVFVAGAEVTFTWLTSASVQLDAPAAFGAEGKIIRATALDDPLVDWADGANINAQNLDAANLQLLYLAQESEAAVLADDLIDLAAAVGAAQAAQTAAETAKTAAQLAETNAETAETNAEAAQAAAEAAAGAMVRRTISGASTIVAGDKGGIVEITSGFFTLAFDPAATLGANFWCIIQNSGSGDIILDPNASELIDGVTTWPLYPGGTVLVWCSGTAFESTLLAPMRKEFNGNGTFSKPPHGTWCLIEAWGAGGSGGRAGSAKGGGGGGGGAYVRRLLPLSALGANETVTIGAGGPARTVDGTTGAAGGNTTFGSILTAYGGGGGNGNQSGGGGGGGGGTSGVGTTATAGDGADGGQPTQALVASNHASVAAIMGFGGNVGVVGGSNTWGGGGGGGGNTTNPGSNGGEADSGGGGGGGGASSNNGGVGGDSQDGGAGGGGGSGTGTGGAGGISLNGGPGGAGSTGAAAATAGSAPGGGGGGSESGNSGAGANGRVIVYVW